MSSKDASGNLRWSKLAGRSRRSIIADLMAQALVRPELISLAAGFTDNAVVPDSIVREAVANLPADGSSLQYGSNQGRAKLRAALAERMCSLHGELKGAVDAQGVVMTNGSQQSLYLLAQVLCDEGDIALVESPTYFVIFDLLAGLGIKAMPLPMTMAGQVDADATARLLESLRREGCLDRVKLAYFITYYSNPATTSMNTEVKRALGLVFSKAAPNVVVLEDTAYRDLYFTTPHDAPSMFAMPEWDGLPIVQTGSFSKCFSPGLRLGYLATRNEHLVEQILRVKAQQDFGSTNLSQWIAEYALTRGLFEPFVSGLRQHYHSKAKALSEALEAGGLRDMGWNWNVPDGGLLMWLQAPKGLDTSAGGAFCKACLDANVIYVPGDICYANADAPKNGVRLAIGVPSTSDLKEAARRFSGAFSSVRQ